MSIEKDVVRVHDYVILQRKCRWCAWALYLGLALSLIGILLSLAAL